MVGLKGFETLKDSKDFSKYYSDSKKWHSSATVIFYKKCDKKKIGFTASKKVGNAVKRNRAKRRLRGIFLEIENSLKDGIYIFVAKNRINDIEYESLKKEIQLSLKRLNALKK